MGKRSTFPPKPNAGYDTPLGAVVPLVRHLPAAPTLYAEPCAGNGKLIDGLARLWPHGKCLLATDIAPRSALVGHGDALEMQALDWCGLIITNPPWPKPGQKGAPTVPILAHLSHLAPTWALLNADFAHCHYFAALEARCAKIVSVGRVSWEENGVKGKENAAWFLFRPEFCGQTRFFGVAA